MADAQIVIGTDTEQVRQDADKTLKSVGKSAGDSFEKALGKLTRGVVIAKAIGDALKAAADEYNKIKEDSQQIGQANLKGRLGQAQTAARLGLGGTLLATIQNASGATSEDQRAAFAASLSEDTDKGENRRAIALQATGLYSDQEIAKALEDGTLNELESGASKRRSQLGPDYEKSVRLADQERQQLAAKRQAVSDVELGQSAADRSAELARLQNPITASVGAGITAGLGKVPVAGGLLESLSRGSQDIGFRLVAAMEKTAENTKPTTKLNMSGVQDSQ